MEEPVFPIDVLHLICETLGQRHDFDTLFRCALVSKAFAIPALTNLYRYHHYSPVRGGGEDEALHSIRFLMVQRWAILWRSIIASSLGATLFPYCRYIRTLDFRDLDNLLDDDQFVASTLSYFFAAPLDRFHLKTEVRTTRKRIQRLNNTAIIDAIGEEVTQHTPTLESFSGRLPTSFINWVPRVPRLQALELFDGRPLEDESVHAAIYENCPKFNSLSIYTWAATDRDHRIATFISGLKESSLKFFQTIRDVGVSTETFLALTRHKESLRDLRLCLSDESLPHLSELRDCTSLETLRLEDTTGRTELESAPDDAFLKVTVWLQHCKNLRNLVMTNFPSAAALTMPLLLENDIKLRHLELDSYVVKDHQAFHQALAHQASSLRVLSLSGDTDEMGRDDLDLFVDTLSTLVELRELKILLPEILDDGHYVQILSNLPHLEELYITGLSLTDAVLPSLADLRNLRSVTFNGISQFSFKGLKTFIGQLGGGNRGLRVMIDMADPDRRLWPSETEILRKELEEKVNGTLEYTLYRDPDISEFEGDSD